MRRVRYLACAGVMLVTSSAAGQTAKTIQDEYANAIKSAENIAAFGPELFGEEVNLKDGVTTFSAVDVTAKLNSGLPMAIGRSLGINARDVDEYVDKSADGELFGNWKLEVPVIRGTFDERTGWITNTTTPQLRCSKVMPPPPVKAVPTGKNIDLYPEQYWHGNVVEIPGKGELPLLGLPTDRTRPADGKTYYWTTKENWRVTCTSTLKNATGEGYVVVLPDGTRYTFDWMSSRKVASLEDATKQLLLRRREYFLHATRVEDRFGNWISYDYDPANPRRLRSITSSDGASITLGYGSHGKISTVAFNGRTWQYQYTSSDGAALAAVVQPDGSRWTFQYGNLYTLLHHDNQRIIWLDCEPHVPGQATAAVTIGHPSGATGTFQFRAMMHGTDRTPGGCYLPDPDQPLRPDLSSILMVYKAASLTSKQITGPGLPTQTWSYSYQPSWSWNPSGYVDDCSWPGTVCNSTVTTSVTSPDGRITRSTFGNDYYRSAGQLLSVDTVVGTSSVQTATRSYLASAAVQPFPDSAGFDLNPRNNRFVTEKNRPLQATTTTRDGDTFSWSVLAYDAYARPTQIMKSNSLGAFKLEVTDYQDSAWPWVLGQVRRTYLPSTNEHGQTVSTSMVSAETEYDAKMMPWKTYSFGKLQQILGYTALGNLSTITDGNGKVTSLGDYYRGVPRTIGFPATPEAPAGATMSATVDGNGWITATQSEAGHRTCFGYDAMGRVSSITYPSETQLGVCDGSRWAPVTRSFQQMASEEHGLPAGHWRLARYEGSKHINTYYDAMWRPVLEETLDAFNGVGTLRQIVKRYDVMGRESFVSYPQRGVGSYLDVTQGTQTSYDVLDRVTRVEQVSEAAPLVTVTEYLSGLRKRTTNPRGHVTTASHLAWDVPNYDLPIGGVLPENKVLQIERHPRFGWPLRFLQRSADSAQQQARRYVYDANGQLCKTIEPETGATVMTYDAAGNLSWSAAGLSLAAYGDLYQCNRAEAATSGRSVTRAYDARGRLTSLVFPDTRGSQSWSYTADGLAASVAVTNEASGTAPVVTTYTYNSRRLPATESINQPGWYTWAIGYSYDSLGNLASRSYPTGLAVDFAPDALGQATKVGSFASNAQYYPSGALKQFTYGNGIVYSMAQNARQLPLHTVSAGVSYLEYGYDQNGNVDHIYDLTDGPGYSPRSRWMSYDGLDRLTTTGAGMFGGDNWHVFTYDALDNLRSWKLAGAKDHADYVYDTTTHRLTSIRNSQGAAVHDFEYDVQGNLRTKNNQALEFDFGNRLRNVAGKERYRYDGQGRRVQTLRQDGSTTLWMYGRGGELAFSWDGSSNQKTHEFLYLAGSLIATVDHHWPSNEIIATKYHHTDALGSPIAVTSSTGAVIERVAYEPYGAVIGAPARDGVGFSGHVMDGATGLTYMQQRYYDQNVGRFLSVDPVTADTKQGSNFNRYWYANNNPYRYTDPDGRQSMEDMLPVFLREKSFGDMMLETVDNQFKQMAYGVLSKLDNVDVRIEVAAGPVSVEVSLIDGKGEVAVAPIAYGAKASVVVTTREPVLTTPALTDNPAQTQSPVGMEIEAGACATVCAGAETTVKPDGSTQTSPKVGAGVGTHETIGPAFKYEFKLPPGKGN